MISLSTTFTRKSLLAIVLSLLLPVLVSGQDNSLVSPWSIELSAGIAEHDKRLYSFPNRARLLRLQPEFFGTYSIGAAIRYELGKRGLLSYSVGFNHLYEVATFERPVVDASVPEGGFIPGIILFVDRHKQLMVAPFAQVSYHFSKSLAFEVRLQPRFRYWVKPVKTDSNRERKGELNLSPRSLESYAGLCYTLGRTNFVLSYRIINVNRFDEYIVNGITHSASEEIPRGYEWFNPVKLTLSVGYNL